MNKKGISWLGKEFIEMYGEQAYDLLIAIATKHDPKRLAHALYLAKTHGVKNYDVFSAALHIINWHGCLKSSGDLHGFNKVFDRESVYHWLHMDPARRAWSVAFNPYRPLEEFPSEDFCGVDHSQSWLSAQAAEISKRIDGGSGWIQLSATGPAMNVKLVPSIKQPKAMTIKDMLTQEAATKLANKLIDEMLAVEKAEEEMALPKWMPHVG